MSFMKGLFGYRGVDGEPGDQGDDGFMGRPGLTGRRGKFVITLSNKNLKLNLNIFL